MSQLCNAAKVPALGWAAPRLFAQLQRDDLGLKELVNHLKLDPGLGARLLHLANSPFFGVSRKVVSVGEAVIVLGLKQTRAVVQVELMRSILSTHTWNIVPVQRFWRRSLTIAAYMQVLAHRVGLCEGIAFSVGIVHNLGMLVLAQSHPKEYTRLMQSNLEGMGLANAERSLFKADHGILGAELLCGWNLPPEMCDAIDQQYQNNSSTAADILLIVLKTSHGMSTTSSWAELEMGMPKQLRDCCDINDQNYDEILSRAQATTQQWLDLAVEI